MNSSDPLSRDPVIAAAWSRRKTFLAAWVESQLLNRADRYGSYYVNGEGITRSWMPPEPLDGLRIERHFTAESVDDVVGVLVTAPDETCRWVVIDIDAHTGDGADPMANLQFALHVLSRALDSGLTALLFDSNGAGGFHVWVLFGDPVPAALAYRLGKWLIHDHASHGIARAPETFPKNQVLTAKRIGNWVRLPGKHHKRAHWTRVWGGEDWLEGRWAVRAILDTRGTRVDLGRVIPQDFDPRPARPTRKTVAARSRRVAASPSARVPSPGEIERARSALDSLGGEFVENYDKWLRVGLALRQLGEPGLELWDDWSQTGATYDPEMLEAKWASFDAANTIVSGPEITLGSLYYWARTQGWVGSFTGRRPGRAATVSFQIETRRITPARVTSASQPQESIE